MLALFFCFTCFTSGRGGLAALFTGKSAIFWLLIALGGLAQACIYFFYYRNLKNYEVWTVKLWLLLMPVLSCFIGIAFMGEKMTVRKAAGIAVVLLGAAIILLRNKLHPEAARENEAAAEETDADSGVTKDDE